MIIRKGFQVAQTAVAFANGAGGKIIFGIKDSLREIIGISDDNIFKTEERITNCIFDRCVPSIVPDIELVLKEVGQAFQVQFVKIGMEKSAFQQIGDQVGTKQAPSRDQAGTKQRDDSEPGLGIAKPESQPELVDQSARVQPESLSDNILKSLGKGPLSKAEISRQLGQKEISGQLNAVIRNLRKQGFIEYTIPEKPNSRLQKYRLAANSD